jgi:cytochrome o ubiquinol oxidase subunit 1
MSGVMLAIAPADYVFHNSEFLVAHFHNVIISGTVFGAIAGYIYWFPKVFGFTLNEKIGKIGFWFFITGYIITFAPLYALGFMGMTRRLIHYDNPAWQLPMWIAAVGVVVIGIAIAILFLQLFVSVLQRKQHLDLTGDPWNGRTLEWSVASPPPHYNFAVIPTVIDRDEYWERKQKGTEHQKPSVYQDILMPKNTAIGFLIGIFSIAFGFGMVWHIWWMAILGFVAILLTIIIRVSNDDLYYYIPAHEVQEHDEQHAHALGEDHVK